MAQTFSFLPAPRRISYTDGTFTLPDRRLILLDGTLAQPGGPQSLRAAAGRFQKALAGLHLAWEQTASTAVPAEQVGLTLRVAPDRTPEPQGYRLHVTPGGILIEGHDPAGVFYGVCTLVQLIEQAGRDLPCLEVQDWPDFPARGVMLDISRDKVFTTWRPCTSWSTGWRAGRSTSSSSTPSIPSLTRTTRWSGRRPLR